MVFAQQPCLMLHEMQDAYKSFGTGDHGKIHGGGRRRLPGCLALFSASMVFPHRIFFPTGFAVNGSSVFQTFRETYHGLLPPDMGCAVCGFMSPLCVCV